MTSYYTQAAERAGAHEQSEPQVVRDRRALCELRAACGSVDVGQ